MIGYVLKIKHEAGVVSFRTLERNAQDKYDTWEFCARRLGWSSMSIKQYDPLLFLSNRGVVKIVKCEGDDLKELFKTEIKRMKNDNM